MNKCSFIKLFSLEKTQLRVNVGLKCVQSFQLCSYADSASEICIWLYSVYGCDPIVNFVYLSLLNLWNQPSMVFNRSSFWHLYRNFFAIEEEEPKKGKKKTKKQKTEPFRTEPSHNGSSSHTGKKTHSQRMPHTEDKF